MGWATWHTFQQIHSTIILFGQAIAAAVAAADACACAGADAGARSPVHFIVSTFFGILVGSRSQNKFTCLYLLMAL